MELNLNSLEKKNGFKDLKGFSRCICGKCDRMYFQKSTLLQVLNPYLEKWKDLPLKVDMTSIKDHSTGFMTINLNIKQTGNIFVEDISKIKE